MGGCVWFVGNRVDDQLAGVRDEVLLGALLAGEFLREFN
jgi:hypothetical protein